MGISRSVQLLVITSVVLAAAGGCKRHVSTGDDTNADAAYDPDACTQGLGCFLVDCANKGLPPTSISGTIYAPNGTLPLYGVNVHKTIGGKPYECARNTPTKSVAEAISTACQSLVSAVDAPIAVAPKKTVASAGKPAKPAKKK